MAKRKRHQRQGGRTTPKGTRPQQWQGDDRHLHAVDDDEIRQTIISSHERFGEVFCPHTACAARVLETLRKDGARGPFAIVATAHPAKFEQVVEPLLRMAVAPPPSLAALLARPASAEPLDPDPALLRERLTAASG